MSYGKKLYKSNLTAFDAENVYDSTKGMLQSEINAAVDTSMSGKVSKTGDTMSGDLNIVKNTEASICMTNTSVSSGSTVGSQTNLGGIQVKYFDNKFVGYAAWRLNSNGSVETDIRARKIVSGVNKDNQLRLLVNNDGSNAVEVTSPTAWCSALNAVNKSGDTMSGALTLNVPLALASGGTGETTASGALDALNGLSKLTVYYQNEAIDTMIDGTALLKTTGSVNTSLYNALGDTYAYVIQIFYGAIGNTRNRMQLAFPYAKTINKIAWREYNSSWGDWHVIRDESDRHYVVNDIFSSTGYGAGAYISNGSKSIHIYITLPKSVENITTVTVTTFTGYIRGPKGYINSANTETNWLTAATSISTAIITNNMVRVTINSAGYTNVDNNTNLFFTGSISLKFT